MRRVRDTGQLNKYTLPFLVKMLRSDSQRKHVGRWLRSQRPNYLLDAPLPWLTFDAIDFIRARLDKNSRVFEYGSGGSTLFWISLGLMCVSIEHDPAWFGVVEDRLNRDVQNRYVGAGFKPAPTGSPSLRERKLGGEVDYRLIEPERDVKPTGDIADPTCYLSDDPNFRGCTFRAYASQIDIFPDSYFDLVLIDGRARPSCIMHSAPKVRSGGMLVLDNADRAYYTQQTQPYLNGFSRLELSGAVPVNAAFSRTDIYIRK